MASKINNYKSAFRAGFRRIRYYLGIRGYRYNAQPHREILKVFEEMSGLQKPKGVEFRIWVAELFINKHEILPLVPSKPRKVKKEKRLKSRKEDYDEYINSKEWRKFREKAFAALGRICSKCGSTNNLHVHHLHYMTFKRETIQDVAILCEPCHMDVHDPKKKPVKADTYYPNRKNIS